MQREREREREKNREESKRAREAAERVPNGNRRALFSLSLSRALSLFLLRRLRLCTAIYTAWQQPAKGERDRWRERERVKERRPLAGCGCCWTQPQRRLERGLCLSRSAPFPRAGPPFSLLRYILYTYIYIYI